MKYLYYILVICCIESEYARCQIVNKAIVGDTILIDQFGYGDDFCGKVNGFTQYGGPYPDDFNLVVASYSSPFTGYIQFTPKQVRTFHQDIYFYIHYTIDNPPRGCPFYHNHTRTYICQSYDSNSSVTLTSFITAEMYGNKEHRQFEDTLSIHYWNNTPDSALITNVRFEGEHSDLISTKILPKSPTDSVSIIEPYNINGAYSVLISSRQGPELYQVYGHDALLIIEKRVRDTIYFDTVAAGITYHSPDESYDVSVNVPDSLYSTTVGNAIYFNDTLIYGESYSNFFFDPIPESASDFQLENVMDSGKTKILQFSFTPSKVGYQNYEYQYSFDTRLYDGSLQRNSYSFNLGGEGLVTSVNKNEPEISVSTYPNPARDRITITGAKLSGKQLIVEVSDLLGRVLLEKNIFASSNSIIVPINRESLSQGIYYLSISYSGHKNVQKLFLID